MQNHPYVSSKRFSLHKWRGFKVLGIVFALTLSSNAISWAAPITKAQATRAPQNIQSLISENVNRIAEAKSARAMAESKLQSESINALNKLKSDYENAKLRNASELVDLKSKLNSSARVKVLVNNISGICPSHPGNCYLNEIVDVPSTFDLAFFLKLGAVELQNPILYNSVISAIEKNKKDLGDIENNYINDGNSLQARFSSNLGQFSTDYYNLVDPIQTEIDLLKGSLTSAKRATKAQSDFLGAFITSFTFEFNSKTIYQVANSPFSSINSVLGARAVLDAVEWNVKAEAIKSSYSNAKAKSFNKIFGNTFISDSEFKLSLKLATDAYKKAAK